MGRYGSHIRLLNGFVPTMTEEQALVHKCCLYHASHRFVAVASASVAEVLVVTPNVAPETWHISFRVYMSKEGHAHLFESVTTSADGTAVGFNNKNRQSTCTSGIVIKHTPTVTNDGTQLKVEQVGAKKVGGGNEDSDWLLKANTKYLVRATSEEAANNITITVKGHE